MFVIDLNHFGVICMYIDKYGIMRLERFEEEFDKEIPTETISMEDVDLS
jgi:hypothetical protein